MHETQFDPPYFDPGAVRRLLCLAAVACPGPAQTDRSRRQALEFTPSEITLKKGETVILVLTSKDVEHGLKLEEFNQVVTVKKGESSQVEVTPAEAGTFFAQCAVFCGAGHGSMKLTIHVTE